MRHRKEPFEYHDKEWDTFERYLKSCETSNQASFNPFEVVFSDPPHLGSAKQTHLYLLSDFRKYDSSAESSPPIPPGSAADRALKRAITVLLPLDNVSGSEFPGRPSPEELFEIPRPPELPYLPKPPSLMLEDSTYPAYYFETAESTVQDAGKALAMAVAKLQGNKTKLSILEGSGTGDRGTNQTIYERKRRYRIELIKRYETLLEYREVTEQTFVSAKNEAIKKYKSLLSSPTIDEALEVLRIANDKYPLPKFLRRGVKYDINQEHEVCVIEFEFPDYRNENLIVGWATRGGYINQDRPKFASETVKRKLVKECLCSLMLRQAYIASLLNGSGLFSHVAVNATQTWFDPATGRQQFGTVASLYVPVNNVQEIDLSQVEPVACVKHLRGLLTPSPESGGAIRPIFTLDQSDARLISNRDVAESLSEQTNLASMDWGDFEHLVAQLLEWEFKNKGMEVGVTQASRDRGVDAILFNPDQLLGGKTVIQAKRYTRTVEVAAVRDLYGTVINEGANRGILITTSSFGPDSYEFAKDKPISLVDGQNLLVMLQKHGRNYRIDLAEARNQLGES
jgi:HJR/Mrr/RecB family endonuclease